MDRKFGKIVSWLSLKGCFFRINVSVTYNTNILMTAGEIYPLNAIVIICNYRSLLLLPESVGREWFNARVCVDGSFLVPNVIRLAQLC